MCFDIKEEMVAKKEKMVEMGSERNENSEILMAGGAEVREKAMNRREK